MRALFAIIPLLAVLVLPPSASAEFPTAAELQTLRAQAAQGYADAQYNLGLLYDDGEGVPQDYATARLWYEQAAAQGYVEAQYNLGLLYAKGRGVPQDYATARQWFEQAAAQDYAAAQSNLGVLYRNGWGVPQDYATARQWFEQAAAQGYAPAQLNLGAMYRNGWGVPQDYVQAHMWLNLAAANSKGDEQKRWADARDRLAHRMTSAQLAEAQRLAREWQQRKEMKPPTLLIHLIAMPASCSSETHQRSSQSPVVPPCLRF